MSILDKNIKEISSLCAKHKVVKLFVFGSILTKQFNKNSDIDFVVDFESVDIYEYADNYFSLKTALENLFQRPIDLIEDKAIKNPFLKQSIDQSKQLIYG